MLTYLVPDKDLSEQLSNYPVRKRKGHPQQEQENQQSANSQNKILNSYRDNFTTHGLSKIFTGVTWEKVLWSVVLFASLSVVL